MGPPSSMFGALAINDEAPSCAGSHAPFCTAMRSSWPWHDAAYARLPWSGLWLTVWYVAFAIYGESIAAAALALYCLTFARFFFVSMHGEKKHCSHSLFSVLTCL